MFFMRHLGSFIVITIASSFTPGCRADLAPGSNVDGKTATSCDTPDGVTTAVIQNGPFTYGLAVDATYVYAATEQGIARAPRAGGPATQINASGEADAIAIDTGRVYWAGNYSIASGSKFASGIGLFSAPIGGGASTLLAASAWSTQIAVDEQSVYGATPSPWSVPIAGGPVTVLSQGVSAFASRSIALYGDNLYEASAPPGTAAIVSIPKLGGAPIVLVGGRTDPEVIAVDSTGIYWAERGYPDQPGGVFRAGLDGSGVTMLAPDESANSLVVDDANVYWTSSETGTIESVSKDGGAVTRVASDLGAPGAIVQYGGNLYWAAQQVGDASTELPVDSGTTEPVVTPTVMTACK
jgi:hypothetical protein